ncbi:hypothetical protein GJ496_008224 [Pomphorhynchus laevis]|nr:hypothetical protein GJ496_008224 [Pomphorhynchus laevis]
MLPINYGWLLPTLILMIIIPSFDMTELTFHLSAHKEQCFYEYVNQNVPIFLEFQVVNGGNNDVDVILYSPSEKQLYSAKSKHYDQWKGPASEIGIYKFCFSNRFSSLADKRVYFDFMAGDEEAGRIPTEHNGPLTFVETSVHSIHKNLDIFIDYFTHKRINDAGDRIVIKSLLKKIRTWSVLQFCVILSVGFGQVALLRSFFR